MANFWIVQAGDKLYAVQPNGTSTLLSLPTDVVLRTTRTPRMVVLGRNVLVVNSPTRNLWIDGDRNVRPMNVRAPATAPLLTATGTGQLSGTFRVCCTFKVKDLLTNDLLAESPFGPESEASSTLVNNMLKANGLPISQDDFPNALICVGLYRTTTGPGSVYFPWIDVDGNVQTEVSDDLPDAALSTLSARTDLGNPAGAYPGTGTLELITQWKNRLWGKSSNDIDTAYFGAEGFFYAWRPTDGIVIPPAGRDLRGITAFIPRRDVLGVSRQDSLHQIAGSTTFSRVGVVEGAGVEAPESVIVTKDIAYWLGKDGVYTWGPAGVSDPPISDDRVGAWFKSDTYFNRALFPLAVAHYVPRRNCYRLFLAAAGSSVLDRFVEYYIQDKRWLGPHKTAEFTSQSCALLLDANDVQQEIIGSSNGFLWKRQVGVFADGASPIEFDVDGPFHSGNTPDIEKYFAELSILTNIEAGGTLLITPRVGALNAPAQAAISHNLTLGRQRLRRLGGPGRFAQLNFYLNTLNRGCSISGFECEFLELGRR